jgi:hypothetical protein
MVSSLLAGINALLVDRGGLMPESLTRKKRRHHRNGGRLQIGTVAGFKSESRPASCRYTWPD